MIDIAAAGMPGHMVNGPGDPAEWDAIDWRAQEARVRRLRQRIFKAAQAGDLAQVRNLQKLMVRHEVLLLPDGGERPSISPPS